MITYSSSDLVRQGICPAPDPTNYNYSLHSDLNTLEKYHTDTVINSAFHQSCCPVNLLLKSCKVKFKKLQHSLQQQHTTVYQLHFHGHKNLII